MREAQTLEPVREKRPSVVKAILFLGLLAAMGAGLTAFALSLRSDEGPKVAMQAPGSNRSATGGSGSM